MDRFSWVMVAFALVFGFAVFRTAFAGDNPPPTRTDRIEKSAEAWRQQLTAEEYRILRDKGTERSFTGKYWDDKKPGIYVCAGCGLELFHSDHKFKSGTGWPSWFKPVADDRVDTHSDMALGMVRTEITCARCGGHLGHVFNDGPKPTGLRYCVNGNILNKKELPAKK